MNTGQKLKIELQKRGLIFKFVSAKTNISYESLKQYLNGHRPMPESKVRLVCMTFGIDLKIFGLDDTYKFQQEAI